MSDLSVQPQLLPGEQLTLSITDLISDGRGLARYHGLAVFVADALPGQQVVVEVVRVKPRLVEAQLLTVLTPAANARIPHCPHVDECGGCSWQAMPYADQLHWKTRFVHDALQRLGRQTEPTMLPALASPKEWGYRNKMEFAFAMSDDQQIVSPTDTDDTDGTPTASEAAALGTRPIVRLGLRQRASHGVVDVTSCCLQTALTMQVVATVRELVRGTGVPAWNRQGRRGFWRFLVVREPAAGGCLVELITAPSVTKAEGVALGRTLGAQLLEKLPAVTGFVHSERADPADVAYGERTLGRQGQSELTEQIADLTLQLGPGAFFQVNTGATACLYAEVARMAALTGSEHIWDLYCGVGSIGLYLAQHKPGVRVLGMEQSASAVTLARSNAEAAGVHTARFVAGDVSRLLLDRLPGKTSGAPADVVVADPPRAGLDARVVRSLLTIHPRRLIYVSCDPGTLARDTARLCETGQFRLESVRPVDLFPHTPHIESAALFVGV